jgi:uncharacterized protein with HEPN domain
MPRRTDVVLREILMAIDGVDQAVAGRTALDFRNDWFLQRGVERAIEIISEAVRHIPVNVLDQEPYIDWTGIRAIGNIIRHEYHHQTSSGLS